MNKTNTMIIVFATLFFMIAGLLAIALIAPKGLSQLTDYTDNSTTKMFQRPYQNGQLYTKTINGTLVYQQANEQIMFYNWSSLASGTKHYIVSEMRINGYNSNDLIQEPLGATK